MSEWRQYIKPSEAEALPWFEQEHKRAKDEAGKWAGKIERIRNRCILRMRRASAKKDV